MTSSETNGVVSTSIPQGQSLNSLDLATRLEADSSMFQEASPEQRAALLIDAREVVAQQGMAYAEYLEALETWPGDAASYLAEQGDVAQEGTDLEPESLDGTDTEPSDEQPNSADQAAELVAQEQEQAQERAEQAEAEYRAQCSATLKALVKAYSRGERHYRDGLLESGRLCQTYIAQRMGHNEKRAQAVQAIEGRLAEYATDTVDVNRLIRCWAAWELLAEQTGMSKAAASVAYGHYRDAWALVLERAEQGKAAEHFVLLPGLEDKCRSSFKAAVEAGLSKQACIDQARELVRAKLALDAKVKADQEAKAKADKQAADQAAAEARKATQEAQKQADDAEQAVADAKLLAEQAQGDVERAALEQAALEQEAKHKAATVVAEQKRAADEHARALVEQKAREEATAKEEAKVANRKRAEAEAKAKVKADKEQGKAQGKATEDKPAAGPAKPEECKAGPNLLHTAKEALPKDTAEFVVGLITTSPEPDDVLELVCRALLQHKDTSKVGARACQAALLALTRKDKPTVVEQPATVKQPA